MASFQKYKTNAGWRWMFKIYTDIDPRTGKKRSTTRRGFKSKSEAEVAARQMENDLDAGLGFNNSPITFGEFAEKWINLYEEENGVKPGTIRVRRHELSNLNKHFKNIRITDISWQQYQKALHDMHEQFAKNTLDGIHRTGRMIFKKAIQLDVIRKDPTEFAYLPKQKVTVEELENAVDIPEYMEKEELAMFLQTAKQHGLLLDFEIFVTLAYTGIRVGELCALKDTDIRKTDQTLLSISKTYYNPKNNVRTFQLVTPKTKASRRLIDIDPMVQRALDEVIESNDDLRAEVGNEYFDERFIFVTRKYPGYPIYPKIIQQRMDRILKLSPIKKRFTPHSLRHTHASLLAEAGVSLERIMERLGHSDDRTTKSIYLHTTESVRKRDAEKFGNLMNNLMDF